MSAPLIVVIGGANMDILGVPTQGYTPLDSNIGRVQFRPGGVGRNIAAQCARLTAGVAFITAFGSDQNAEVLKASCLAAQIDIGHSFTENERTSVYLCIHDEKGSMVAAINDMPLNDKMTEKSLAAHLHFINSAKAVILDANLPEATLRFLAGHIIAPLILDPVSCHKAPRILPILPRIAALKPNLLEACLMTNEQTPAAAAAALVGGGVQRVFISLGKEGVYYADTEVNGLLSPAIVFNSPETGAGDAMTAGIALAVCQGRDTKACAQAGMDAAAKHLAL